SMSTLPSAQYCHAPSLPRYTKLGDLLFKYLLQRRINHPAGPHGGRSRLGENNRIAHGQIHCKCATASSTGIFNSHVLKSGCLYTFPPRTSPLPAPLPPHKPQF
ncbi:MAG: hypothetical protein QXR18_09765, partial [Pyrobaculum sp.]